MNYHALPGTFQFFPYICMHMDKKLVIIPTYNEIENISKIIQAVFALEGEYHILVIDDGSPDGTAAAVRKLQPEYPERLHLVERSGKLGGKTAEEYVEDVRAAFDTPEAWPQEFECEFLDASANLLSFDQITAAESVEATERGFDPNEPGEFYGGFDFGGIKDPSIFWLAKKVVETGADGKPVEKLVTRDVLVLRELDTEDQIEAVKTRMDKCVRVCVDYSGPGRGFGDMAVRRWGEYDADPKKFLSGKVEKFTFTEPSKRELFTPFRLCFGKVCTFLIPHVDWIRQDFHGVQMLLKGKDYVFWAPRMSGGHSDGACAAALCRRASSFGGEYIPPFAATAAHDYESRSIDG